MVSTHGLSSAQLASRYDEGFFEGEGSRGVALVETAGGVCSPGPSGTLQCDLLRPLRLPAVLVGDANLGGISTTITALDVLAGGASILFYAHHHRIFYAAFTLVRFLSLTTNREAKHVFDLSFNP